MARNLIKPVILRPMKTLIYIPIVLIFAAVFLTGCSDPISRDNYEQIKTGMSQEEVFSLLGEPNEFESVELGELSGGTARWIGSEHMISVTFTNEKAAFKRFGEPPEAE